MRVVWLLILGSFLLYTILYIYYTILYYYGTTYGTHCVIHQYNDSTVFYVLLRVLFHRTTLLCCSARHRVQN